MITITISEQEQQFQQTFNKERVIIGSGSPEKIDLPLNIEEISEHHVQILWENGHYSVTNSTHDPHVTLNNLSFGTRTLRQNDTLVVHGTVLHFDKVKSAQIANSETAISDKELCSLLDRVDALDDNKKELPKGDGSENLISNNPISIKCCNPLHFITLVVATILFLLGSGIYMATVNEHYEEMEEEATVVAADIAMALTYAKLHHISAPRDNWSSPEFIRKNLENILIKSPFLISSMSANGRLQNNPYLIRIYTSQDLSRFLIIAQPSSHYSHYFSPRASILIDSEKMELRKIDDIKSLNRLLANPYALDTEQVHTVASLIDNGKLITLKSIGIDKKRYDLIPPKGLGFIRSSADLKIYNTPRYHKLTEWIVSEAAKTEVPQSNTLTSQPPFFEELQRFSPLQDLVYYTTEGIESALHAYEVFHVFFPNEEMLIGWLSLDTDEETITNSLLITLKGTPHAIHQFPPNNHQIAMESLSSPPSQQTDVDMHSRWFEEMVTLRTNRTKNLESLSEALSHLLNQHTQEADPNFEGRFHYLYNSYEQIDEEELQSITKNLQNLYQEYREYEPFSSPSRFLYYIRMTGLEFFVNTDIMQQIEQDEIDRLAKDKIDQYQKRIKGAQKLSELEKHIITFTEFLEKTLASKSLKIQAFKDIRECTHEKLRLFLNSDDHHPYSLREEDRYTLEHILRNRHISTEEEQMQYLHAFDKHL